MTAGVAGLEPNGRGEDRREHGSGVLPVAASVLVGREHERVEVAGLLARGRLVTLTGAGGCGKTRLALEVATDMAAGFVDAICWVDLAGVGNPDTVPAALADAAGVHEEPGRGLVDTLVEQLRAWQGLVVLDNCEHLIGACAALVAALLRSCPQVRVLATSRTPLAVEGETTWEVAPLSVPDAEARSVSEVGRADAAWLFEVRARQVRPDFTLSDDNAQAVASICRRLDGIPLAVELAAARVRVLSAAQIAVGLSDRFRLLTGGAREAPARQQTLEASVAWSFGLLADAERLALARLSVFAGSFDLEAAQAVVVGPGIEQTQVLDLVAALADRSLLQVAERDGVARYRLLETIRAYAWERLGELDDPARVRDRHLDRCVALARQAGTQLASSEPRLWLDRLAADLDDLRAAMDWAVESGRRLAVLDIAEPTQRFWFERRLHLEMYRRVAAAVDAPAASDADRARGLTLAGLFALAGGDYAVGHDFAARAVALARAEGEQESLARALVCRSWCGFQSGEATDGQARADVDEAVALAEDAGDDASRAQALSFAGRLALCERSVTEGQELLEQALELAEATGSTFTLTSIHAFLGLWSSLSADLDRAREHAWQALALSRRHERPGFVAYALTGLAVADLLQGEGRAARQQLAQASELTRSLGLSVFHMVVCRWAAVAAYHLGDLPRARDAVEAARGAARDHGSRRDEAACEWLLGLLAVAEQRSHDAERHLEQCRRMSVDPRYPFTLGRALIGLAGLHDDPDEAWELAHGGLEVLADFGDRVGTAEALEAVAGLAAARDHPDQALRLLAAAERFHDETGIVRFPLAAERATRHAAAARAQLDADAAEACWAEGVALSLEDAVAYARRRRGERRRPPTGWAALTPTERQLVRLVAEGLTNADIGERLFVSPNTVKKHLSHVYAKLDVEGRAELAAQATRHGL